MPFNEELSTIYENCYKPIIESNGLNPIVLTQTRTGSPVYFQITSHIQTSKLIIADLTIARPNCYFEVGYAIGHGKQDGLILCCREDHIVESPKNPRHKDKSILAFNMVRGLLPKKLSDLIESYLRPVLDQHKIHFDLAGYNILWWGENLEAFKLELDKEIKQRLQQLQNSVQTFGNTATPQATPTIQKKKITKAVAKQELDEISRSQQEVLKNVKN